MDLLTVARICHNHDPWNDTSLRPFYIHNKDNGQLQIGFLTAPVVEKICEDVQAGKIGCLQVQPSAERAADVTGVSICRTLTTGQEISEALKQIVERWRDLNAFPDPLKGWRNELYSIYAPAGREAFRLERAACALFGLATFGVHATAYTPDYRIWVPRRAQDKSTWPGYLDNSVAGGITAGDGMLESMVRECWEEAGLKDDVVRRHMRQTGVISYVFRTQKQGWIQPEVEYTYDIALPDDSVILHPVDGEAEDFTLMDKDEILRRIRKAEFKPNCALVLIDFFIRHGILTIENCDCDYTALVCALHNDLRLPGP